MSVNINELANIKDLLETLDDESVLYVEEDGENKYVIMTSSLYDGVAEVAEALKNGAATAIKVAMPNFELSYEDYENIKRQVDEALDKAFRPKPEKLN